MYISNNLLKKFISLDVDPKLLMSELTLHAAEIEQVIERTLDDLLVVWYVQSVEKHPDADKLVVCQVDCGQHGVFQICTAADNMAESTYVPVALPGSYLEAIDLKIGSRTMRGVASDGMICAKSELGIAEDADKHGIWILDEDYDDLTSDDIWQHLSVKFPWLENMILDVDNKTINNRPDLTWLLGMAIELRAIFGAHSVHENVIKHQTIKTFLADHTPARTLEILAHANSPEREITIETDKCAIYSLVRLDDVNVTQSNFLDRLSLIDSGLVSKNNRVDFSNLYMMLTAQPIHVFDADKVVGDVYIRQAAPDEVFVDLLDNKHSLTPEDIVVCDEEKVIALAGVIGGKNTAVSDTTKNVLIEIGHFDPVAVRRTSMRIGVRTDSVMRFEKAPSSLLALTSVSMILDLLEDYKPLLGDYKLVGAHTQMNEETRSQAQYGRTITIDLAQFASLIFGRDVDPDPDFKLVQNILETIWCEVSPELEVSIPRRRGADDLTIPEDIYEEVARLYGYDKIPSLSNTTTTNFREFHPLVKTARTIESVLTTSLGCDQVQTYPRNQQKTLEYFDYQTDQLVALRNPTAPEKKYLRPSMLLNLFEYVAKNAKLFDDFALYDTGQTRDKTEEFSRYLTKQSFETTKLGVALFQKRATDWQSDKFLAAKTMAELICQKLGLRWSLEYKPTEFSHYHPKKQGTIIYQDQQQSTIIGFLGELHPFALEELKIDEKAQVVGLELVIETLADLVSTQEQNFESQDKYLTRQDQIVVRDINFILEKSLSYDILTEIVESASEVIEFDVVDLYAWDRLPDDKKSIVYSLSILGDGSWSADQFTEVVDKITAQAQEKGIEIG